MLRSEYMISYRPSQNQQLKRRPLFCLSTPSFVYWSRYWIVPEPHWYWIHTCRSTTREGDDGTKGRNRSGTWVRQLCLCRQRVPQMFPSPPCDFMCSGCRYTQCEDRKRAKSLLIRADCFQSRGVTSIRSRKEWLQERGIWQMCLTWQQSLSSSGGSSGRH